MSAAASGSESLGPSTAFILSEALLSAFNPTAYDLELTVLFGFDLFSAVSVGNSFDTSAAFSAIDASFSDGTPIFGAFTRADSDFGPLSDSLDDLALPADLVPFTFTLAPSESRTIVLTAVAEVLVVPLAPIPVPAPSLLLAPALTALPLFKAARRRRPRHA